MTDLHALDLNRLADDIKAWGHTLGFQQVGICDVDLGQHEKHLNDWLEQGFHGDMTFMENHGTKRSRPAELVPGTLRVISVRMNYLPPDASFARHLSNDKIAYISRYALGRDYHKVLRKRLKQLGQKIQTELAHTEYRPFVDSAPVLEHAIAEKAGIGWTGKHSLTLNKEAGSWFFLGELFINLPLPVDSPVEEGCGSCSACLTICPTQAIVAPYKVDARRCISYLTIESDAPIPEELRPLMGNRIYGCDDCQLVCPWNRYSQITDEEDFHPRKALHGKTLVELFSMSEAAFLSATEGSPIRRIGYQKWLRNIAVAMGNAAAAEEIIAALTYRNNTESELVQEHIAWALQQQRKKLTHQVQDNRQKQRLTRIVEKGLPRDA